MESQRRTQPPTPTSPTPTVVRNGFGANPGFLARHGNTILTVILLIAAGVLAFRWYTRSADAARSAVVLQLETARGNVDQLRSPQLLVGSMGVPLSSPEVMAKVRLLQSTASGLLSDVINKSEEPAVKARALVVRGDLAWAVANLPELPGATTQPALRPDPPADVLLGQSADAYTAALNNGADKEASAAAHLGLAAVAANRGDWTAAKQHLQTVADDKDAVAILSQAARAQLAELPTLQKPIYLAPPSGIELPPMATTTPTTAPTATPPGVMGPMAPTSRPTTAPATRPAK